MIRLLRLSLRDLFWLTLSAAVLVAWALDYRRTVGELRRAELPPNMWAIHSRDFAYPKERIEFVAKMQTWSDSELVEEFKKRTEIIHRDDFTELYLSELVRRRMIQPLQDELANTQRNRIVISGLWETAVSTALQRAREEPDFVQVRVDLTTGGPRNQTLEFNQIAATIEVDESRRKDFFGGSPDSWYANWRVRLTTPEGETVPDSRFVDHGETTTPGETIQRTGGVRYRLDPRRYLSPPAAGPYRLQVLYGAYGGIAHHPNTDGLIVWASEPLDVVVVRRDQLPYQYPAKFAFPLICVSLVVVTVVFARRSWFSRRDLVFVVIIAAVSAGWYSSQRALGQRILKAAPDAEAGWTMQRAERPA